MIPPADNLPWQQLVDRKARELIEQVAATYDWVKVHGNSDPAFFHDMAADQFQWLRELYQHELPLAKMLDESDLTVELLGCGQPDRPPTLERGVIDIRQGQEKRRPSHEGGGRRAGPAKQSALPHAGGNGTRLQFTGPQWHRPLRIFPAPTRRIPSQPGRSALSGRRQRGRRDQVRQLLALRSRRR